MLFSAADDVAVVTLNRPRVLNAINVGLLDGLVAALRDSQGARAVVIAGSGTAFCVGEDLRDTLAPRTGSAEELRTSFEKLQDLTRLMSASPAPVISAVAGYAVGGGAEIALAADLVVVGPVAQFQFPEAVIGHAPTGGITARLTTMVGLMRAKDLLLTGRWVGAEESVRIGLATELHVSPDERALELAAELAGRPRRSMTAVRRAIETAAVPAAETYLRAEVDAASYCFASAETEESFARFKATGRPATT